MSTSSGSKEEELEVIQPVAEENLSSGDEPPMSQWSSLETLVYAENPKRFLHKEGLYSPESGEICAKYIAQSASSVFAHVYYNYPAVDDPGIVEAILVSEKPLIHPDDGRSLYLALCNEMNKSPVRLFHRNLCSSEINLKYYGVDPFGVRAMAMALQYNKYVKRLDLTDNFLNDDACYHLGGMLQSNVTLTDLILSGCRIGPSGLACLMDNLKINRTLTYLDLSRNQLGEDGGVYFFNQLGDGVRVPNVNLSRNELGRLTALAVAEVFEYYPNRLRCLDLSKNNFFQVAPTAKMLNILSDSKVLVELNLSFNSMEGEKIAEAIKNILLCPKLAELDLSNNKFHDTDVSTIASNLYKAKNLVTLNFSRNPLTVDDAQLLIDKMKKPSVKLSNLLLENVDVSKDFLVTLNKVRNMKSRKNFYTTYGYVVSNWVVSSPDARNLLLQRAAYLGTKDKRRQCDVQLFFMQLLKTHGRFLQFKDLVDIVSYENVPLDEDLLNEMCNVFPGPKGKMKTINLEDVSEYIKRLWPDKKLPPTPVEEEPEPPPPSPQPPAKGKGKKK